MRNLVLELNKPQRNDLWRRYISLGMISNWRKDKLYSELKAAGVDIRFTKTACKPGFDLYGMHSALRDILINNGLMTNDEWRSGKLKMNLDEWKIYYSSFRIVVEPLSTSVALLPVRTHRTTSKARKSSAEEYQDIQTAFYPQPV